jgi:ABC-type uncharacterized transport system permease subunit
MKKYLFAAWISFRTHTIYRAEIVLSVLSTLFTLAVQVFLWKSLYASSPDAMEGRYPLLRACSSITKCIYGCGSVPSPLF